MNKTLTWSPIIPLIGGFPIGCENATGVGPTQVISAEPFKANDALYLNYLAQHKKFPPTVDFQKYPEYIIPVNIVVATPPCAGLSTLGQKKAGIDRADNEINHWMYDALTVGINNAKADVVIIENAPGLTSKVGEPVLKKLRKIAEDGGYSTVAYRTSTEYHGLPQFRKRTFFFAFKSKFAPILTFIKKDRLNFDEFLRLVNKDTPHGDELLVENALEKDTWWIYLVDKYGVEYVREQMKDRGTVADVVFRNDLLDDCIAYWEKRGDNAKALKLAIHAKDKFSRGLGIFDSSPRLSIKRSSTFTAKAFATLHPDEDRTITVREGMAMMGLPDDFELLNGRRDHGKIPQNVPVTTAADMAELAVQFINGELPLSTKQHLFIDNFTYQKGMAKQSINKVSQYSLAAFL